MFKSITDNNMKNIRDIKKDTRLYTYDQLSDNSKLKAQREILKNDIDFYYKDLNLLKSKIKTDLHSCINNNSKLKALIRRKKHINKTNNDLSYLRDYILGNLCNFLIDGTYITYCV